MANSPNWLKKAQFNGTRKIKHARFAKICEGKLTRRAPPQVCMWNPDDKGTIRRSDRVPDTPPGISRFQECVLHQGRIERFFLDHMKEHSNIEVERGVLPEALEIDESLTEDAAAYPITVKLRHLSDEEAMPEQSQAPGTSKVSDGLFRSNLSADDTDDLLRKSSGREGSSEIMKTKYVVGCDGAHSWTRRQLGFEMEGEATDYIWGVLGRILPQDSLLSINWMC